MFKAFLLVTTLSLAAIGGFMISENQDEIKSEANRIKLDAEHAANGLVRDAKRKGGAMLEEAAEGAQNKLDRTVMDVKQKIKDSL